MKTLLQRYGQQVVMLDATYNTSKYMAPLFFLCVKTNIDTQVVATFITEDERAPTIAEALDVIRVANPEWRAQFFITDQSDAEISAIESVFTGKLQV